MFLAPETSWCRSVGVSPLLQQPLQNHCSSPWTGAPWYAAGLARGKGLRAAHGVKQMLGGMLPDPEARPWSLDPSRARAAVPLPRGAATEDPPVENPACSFLRW